MTTAASNQAESPASGEARIPFLVGGALAVIFVFGLAAHAPVQFKKPGLSLLILGVAAGWGLARWAGANKVRSSRFVFVFSAIVIAASAIIATVESHRVSVAPALAAWKLQAAAKNPLAEMFEASATQADNDASPEEQETQRDMLAELEDNRVLRTAKLDDARQALGFFSYLEYRIPDAWGRWKAPLPALFWLGEVLASSVAGAVVATRTLRLAGGKVVG